MLKIIVNDGSLRRETGIVRSLAAMLPVAAALLMSSCAPQHELTARGAAVMLKQDSQKDLVESLQMYAFNGQWDRYASAMESEYRQPFAQMLNSAGDYVKKLDTLADLVKERIGDKQAQVFRDKSKSIRETILPMPGGPSTNGSVDWSKVQLLAEGIGYLVIVSDDETEFSKKYLLLQKGDQWWLTPRMTKVPAGQHKSRYSQYAKGLTKMFDGFSKTTDDMIKDVRSGKLNKDNFEQNMVRPGESKGR
jgi:hypothetical protein